MAVIIGAKINEVHDVARTMLWQVIGRPSDGTEVRCQMSTSALQCPPADAAAVDGSNV